MANTATLKGTSVQGTSQVSKHGRKGSHDFESRRIESGFDILDNNGVNLLMAFLMSAGGILVASFVWNIPLLDLLGRYPLEIKVNW